MGLKETLRRRPEMFRRPEIQTGVGIEEYLLQLTNTHGDVDIQAFTAMSGRENMLVGILNFTLTQFVTDGSIAPSYLRAMRHGILPVNFDFIDGTYVAWSGYPKQGIAELLFNTKPLEHFIQTSFSTREFRRVLAEYHLPPSINIHCDSTWGVRMPRMTSQRQRSSRIALGEKLGLSVDPSQ